MSTWNVNLDSAWRSFLSKDTLCWKDGESPRVSSNNMDYLTAILLMGTHMLIYFALSKRLMTNDCQVSIYDAVSGQNVQVFKSPFILRPSSTQSASASFEKPELSLESIRVLYYNDHFGMARDLSPQSNHLASVIWKSGSKRKTLKRWEGPLYPHCSLNIAVLCSNNMIRIELGWYPKRTCSRPLDKMFILTITSISVFLR